MTDARIPAADAATSDDMEQLTGKGGGGESGGGAYPNPHTGKEQRGKKQGLFQGGQSENRYYGPKDAQSNSAKGAERGELASDEADEGT